jgi:hypothetical protein
MNKITETFYEILGDDEPDMEVRMQMLGIWAKAWETALASQPVKVNAATCLYCGEIHPLTAENREQVLADMRVHDLTCSMSPLNQRMPCGHLARYAYPPAGDSGTTHYCLLCQAENNLAPERWRALCLVLEKAKALRFKHNFTEVEPTMLVKAIDFAELQEAMFACDQLHILSPEVMWDGR